MSATNAGEFTSVAISFSLPFSICPRPDSSRLSVSEGTPLHGLFPTISGRVSVSFDSVVELASVFS